MLKKYLILFVIVLVIVFLFSVSKNLAIKTAVEKIVENITGLRLVIEKFSVSLIKTTLGIKELLLFNPKGFTDKIMFDISEFYVDFDLPSLLRKELYLKHLRLNLSEIYIIKDKEGKLNLASLTVVKAQRQGEKPSDIAEEKPPKMRIDNFELKIKKVIYKDYSAGVTPRIIEANINLDEKFQNIDNPYSLVRIILVKAIEKAALAQFININLEMLAKPISTILESATQVTTGATKAAQDISKQATDVIKGIIALPTGKAPEEEVKEEEITIEEIK
jgi:uncharacterized protein involved in outer membrane biogenesis